MLHCAATTSITLSGATACPIIAAISHNTLQEYCRGLRGTGSFFCGCHAQFGMGRLQDVLKQASNWRQICSNRVAIQT
jgi:hypothetical protein